MGMYNAQDILDQLHAADVPGVLTPGLSSAKQRDRLKQAKARLATARANLDSELAEIHPRNDDKKKRKKGKDEVESARPRSAFEFLEELLVQLEDKLAELEIALKNRRLVPEAFAFDRMIFGSETTGEWALGDEKDAERWESMERVKLRLDDLMQQRAETLKRKDVLTGQIKTLDSQIKEAAQTVRTQGQRAYILKRVGLRLVIALIGGAGAVVFFTSDNLPVAAGAAVIGLLALLTIPSATRKRRKTLAEARENIVGWKSQYKQQRAAYRKLQQEFLPLNDRCKEVHTEYTELRASF